MEYDEEGRIEFGSPRDPVKPYDHAEWLRSLRRECPRCGPSAPGMRISNVEQATTLMPEPVNGFVYAAWPVYRCTIHHYTCIL